MAFAVQEPREPWLYGGGQNSRIEYASGDALSRYGADAFALKRMFRDRFSTFLRNLSSGINLNSSDILYK